MTTSYQGLLILMAVVWASGRLCSVLRVPIVFGELIGGILVGPPLLNIIDPHNPVIHVFAELGIFFLMLHAGLKTDPRELLGAKRLTLAVGLMGFVLSLGGGYVVARLFGVTPLPALFCGMCAAVSAPMMLSRVLKDSKLLGSDIGHVALGAGFLQDILVLTLFGVLLNSGTETVTTASLLLPLLASLFFFAAVLIAGKLLTSRVTHFFVEGRKGFTLTMILALLLGVIAEHIGLHMMVGSFLAGMFVRGEAIDAETYDKIEDRFYALGYSMFGPIFFATLAFGLQWPTSGNGLLLLGALSGVAIVTKILGAGIPLLLEGRPWLQGVTLGMALNTRGSVELVLAGIGHERGILSTMEFSALLLMALLTTMFSIGVTPMLARKIERQ